MLLSLAAFSNAEVHNEEQIEGAILENIGSVKVIEDYETIDFSIRFPDVIASNNQLMATVTERKLTCENGNCKMRMESLLEVLTQNEISLGLIYKSLKGNPHSRTKRWDPLGLKYYAGIADTDDTNKILATIDDLRTSQSKLFDDNERLESEAKRLSFKVDQIQKTLESLLDQRAGYEHDNDDVILKVGNIRNQILSFANIIATGKSDGILIQPQYIEEKMKEMAASLTDEYLELGFSSPVEFMTLTTVETEMSSDFVKFSMKMPIVKSQNFTLRKINKSPTKFDNFVAVLSLDTEYVAIGDDEFKPLTTLASCIEKINNEFLCEISETQSESKCLLDIVLLETIDMTTCMSHIFVAKLPSAVLIENDLGEAWFNFEKQEDVFKHCGKEIEIYQTSGTGWFKFDTKCTLKLDGKYEIRPSFARNVSESSLVSIKYENTFAIKVPAPRLENFGFYDMKEFLTVAESLDHLLKEFRALKKINPKFIKEAVSVNQTKSSWEY